MPCPPAVVAASVRIEWLFPEDTAEPRCQPVLDVVIKERYLGRSDASYNLAACRFLPDAGLNPGYDLAELNTGSPLVPASATPVPAVAVASLVQEHGLPLAIRAEPQTERQCPVGLYFAVKRPRRPRRHQTPTARLRLRYLCTGIYFLLSQARGR